MEMIRELEKRIDERVDAKTIAEKSIAQHLRPYLRAADIIEGEGRLFTGDINQDRVVLGECIEDIWLSPSGSVCVAFRADGVFGASFEAFGTVTSLDALAEHPNTSPLGVQRRKLLAAATPLGEKRSRSLGVWAADGIAWYGDKGRILRTSPQGRDTKTTSAFRIIAGRLTRPRASRA
jgi:hypothetical protein